MKRDYADSRIYRYSEVKTNAITLLGVFCKQAPIHFTENLGRIISPRYDDAGY